MNIKTVFRQPSETDTPTNEILHCSRNNILSSVWPVRAKTKRHINKMNLHEHRSGVELGIVLPPAADTATHIFKNKIICKRPIHIIMGPQQRNCKKRFILLKIFKGISYWRITYISKCLITPKALMKKHFTFHLFYNLETIYFGEYFT